jgi:signal transduction histidine kinase
MRRLKQKHWVLIFTAVHVLVVAQVIWWAMLFTRDAELIASLQRTNAGLAQASGDPVPERVLSTISNEAYHRKVMFLSESLFFAAVACVGLWVLYRALRSERRSREVQRNFIEIVSHESKTPLTALKLRLESLRDKAAEPETALSISRALDEVRRLSGVLDKTMDLNRSERQALQFESLCLAEVVESVVRRLEPWLTAKNTVLTLELDEEIEVLGDFASLQNSVQSLLENAVLYNPAARRKVAITLVSRGARALLSVADDGPGIAASDQARVFERFYRGGSGHSVSGTGLGLYLAKVIVEAHRGVLRLARGNPGACFEMDLPTAGGV